MRILHLGKYFCPVAGGMERFLGDLVTAQRAAGDVPSVLVHGHAEATDPPWLRRVPVWFRLFFAPISPAFPFWLHRAIRDFRPDVLHVHLPNLSAFWALMVPSARRLPWVVHWHADVEISRRSLRLAYPHYHMFERAVLEKAERVIVSSREYLAASAPLRPWRDKCEVIPLGIDPARLPEVPVGNGARHWRGDGLKLLAVGRLTYYKGFETLIRAVAGDADLDLVIVGEGEERPRLERLIAESHAHPHARLLGQLDDDSLMGLMASCDVFCLPSCERTEAFGIVLLEAMRYGKPLVVSDIEGSGVRWVARAGQNALAVPTGDVAAWRAALAQMQASPAERQRLGQLGRYRYEREFEIGPVAAAIHGAYRKARQLHAREALQDVHAAELDARLAGVDPARPEDDLDLPPRTRTDRLLVVIPALNEAECIATVIERARQHPNVDILVVDDGSSDDTSAVARLAGATVLRAPLWQGAWGAIQTGIRYALRHGYSGVVTMDADGQHEPAYLPQLLEAAKSADTVIAACPARGSTMRHVAWRYFRFLTGFTLEDLTSGFRYYNARACRLLAAEEATLLDYQDIGVLLVLHHAKLRIAEIPVAMNPRKHGASRVFSSWWTVARYMAETSLLCLARWNAYSRKTATSRERAG
jgi:glycosyltransferase involved in cell wall biosynthesis